MKLYYAPGACSLATHIALREAGIPFEAVKVDLRAKKAENGEDYFSVTSKGYVPALRLDSGEVLTECTAVLPFVADQKPSAALAPPAGTLARARLHEWLGYISSELHKNFGAYFIPGVTDAEKQGAGERLAKRFDWLQPQLEGRSFLIDDQFTVADAYLFNVLGWTSYVGIDLGKWPGPKSYHARIGARPAVQAAMKAEGLIK